MSGRFGASRMEKYVQPVPWRWIMYLVLPTAWFERWFLQLLPFSPTQKIPRALARKNLVKNQGFTSFYIPSCHIPYGFV